MAARRWLVVKLSGRAVDPSTPDTVKGYAEAIRALAGEWSIAVVVGGGATARSYIEASGRLGASKYYQDLLGIEASRLNALLLITALGGEAHPTPPRSLEELLAASRTARIVVMGGLQPGQSTTTVAALAAEALEAEKLILATRAGAVYDKDPARHPDAKPIPVLTITQLMRLVEQSLEPGHYELIDPYAASILKRSKITLHIIPTDPAALQRAARGEPIGSLVLPQ